MTYPERGASYKNNPKWLSELKRAEGRTSGGKIDEEFPTGDKMSHGDYYGRTSSDAVKQVSHFKAQGDYDPYEAMKGPDSFAPEPSDPYADRKLSIDE